MSKTGDNFEVDEESILTSIKKMLGIAEDYTYFDTDIKIHINSAFSILTQLGVGPESGFSIHDKDDTWDDFIDDYGVIEMLKSYIYLRVRLLFDPPTNSFTVDAIEREIAELEWRLHVAVEPYTLLGGDSDGSCSCG